MLIHYKTLNPPLQPHQAPDEFDYVDTESGERIPVCCVARYVHGVLYGPAESTGQEWMVYFRYGNLVKKEE
jgi:hypothetical protein